MVRRVELSLIEDELSRQLSYAKRRNGLIKKALELYMVCGVDSLFISFSPSGRLSYFSGEKRVEDVFSRLAALPEDLRKLHLPDLELEQLLPVLEVLKDQTEQYTRNDRNISALQREILRVKEEIKQAQAELRPYQPIAKAIMTVTEANTSEGHLEEVLAKVQERKKELEEYPNNGNASQPTDSMIGLENISTNPSDEVQQQSELDQQPNVANQSPTSEGQITSIENSAPASLLFELPTPPPPPAYQAGTSFTSLLLSPDVTDETLSPIQESEPAVSQKNNNNDSFTENQLGFSQDGLNNNHFYSNVSTTERDQSSGQNGTMRFPESNLIIPSDFQIPETFELQQTQQMQQLQLQSSAADFGSFSLPSTGNVGQQEVPLVPSNLQWSDPNPTPIRSGGFQDLLYSIAGVNMLPDTTTPTFQSSPSPLTTSHHSSVDHGIPQNMQGTLANSSLEGVQGNQMSAPSGHLEGGGGGGGGESSSSAQKRKLPWDNDIYMRLTSTPSRNAVPNSASAAPRPLRNLAYNTAHEIMGLPIDPHFRMFQDIYAKGKEVQETNQ